MEMLNKEDYGLRFFGIPSEYEYMSLVEGAVSEDILLEHLLKAIRPERQEYK